MGACQSCLGNRRQETFDEDDVSRLLIDDPNNFQYGSFSDQNMNAQADPLESQRENEAVQKVVAKTSNNLVDIFEIAPQETQQAPHAMLSGQDLRLSRYQTILAKLSTDDDLSSAGTVQGHLDWTSDDDLPELQGHAPSIKDGVGKPLVGTFSDAAAAA
ncbi:hypothetical protein PG993_011459 [Apiospora rasikravindrae]|uniref:Late endosomal/lysosomal adaptor and MAPK and MTOR activator-domain-containing protein n=1 Tax=Apiospora rasikravindrae TaxID=990691 RepID=A0ABR1SEG6_9PEZI